MPIFMQMTSIYKIIVHKSENSENCLAKKTKTFTITGET